MTSPHVYKKENDVELVDVILRSKLGAEVSLLPDLALQIHIYEDIYSPCLKGEVIIADGANFIGHFPIIGQEEIVITFKTPGVTDDYITHTFYVYKTTPRMSDETGPQRESYALYFASPEFIENSHIKCHKTYTGTATSIVETIMKDNFPDTIVNLEESRNTMRLIAPYWSPFKCIDWLSRRAVTTTDSSNEANFLMYQTLSSQNGEYNFISLSTLSSADSVEFYNHGVGDGQDINSIKNPLATLNRVITMDNEKYVDKLENIQTGMFASTLFTHDITYKKFDNFSYSYDIEFSRVNNVNDFPIMPSGNDRLSTMTDTVLHFLPKQDDLYLITDSGGKQISEPPVDNFFQQDWLLHRKSLLEQINLQKHKIRVSGDTRRRAGDIITLNLPTNEVHETLEESNDLNMGGRFLVTSIKHVIDTIGPTHEMVLELSRDSLPIQIPDQSTFIAPKS